MTTTKIANLPGNWNVDEGGEPTPEWENEIETAVDEMLAKWFSMGDIFRVGDEIWGPATLIFPDADVEIGTPDASEITGIERLENYEWVDELLETAGELVMQRAGMQV